MVESMRRVARRFYIEGLVDRVLPVMTDAKTLRRFACDWLILPVAGEENTSTDAELLPTEGFIFRVEVGRDCEPLWLGLCRYPATVHFQGRELPAKKGAGGNWPVSARRNTPVCMAGNISNGVIAP